MIYEGDIGGGGREKIVCANDESIYSERAASQLQLTSDLCDITVPLAALNWVGLDDGFVGLAGTLSSLIGVYTQWKKTA